MTQRSWLAKDLLVTHAPDTLSSTVHINHVDCPAGEDTKARLYITRTMDGTVLGYCHHCGMRGFIPNTDTPNIHTHAAGTAADYRRTLERHTMSCKKETIDELLSESFPPETTCVYPVTRYQKFGLNIPLREYMDKYDLSAAYMEKDMWFFGSIRGVYMFIFPFTRDEEAGTMTGVQIKLIPDTGQSLQGMGLNKTYSFGRPAPHIFNPDDSTTVVVCEDRVSGVKIAQAGYAACVLHGSYILDAEYAHALSLMFDKIVVWYDNDNPTVISNATKTYQVLSMFTDSRFILLHTEDPKVYTTLDICQAVRYVP